MSTVRLSGSGCNREPNRVDVHVHFYQATVLNSCPSLDTCLVVLYLTGSEEGMVWRSWVKPASASRLKLPVTTSVD
jgi:hypothetical protein